MKEETIEHIMTADVCFIDINETLQKAKSLMHSKKIRHLPVIKNDKLIGMLSQTDIMRLSFGDIYDEPADSEEGGFFDMLSIDQIMKHNPKYVTPSDKISDVARILTTNEFHALPVVKDDQLVGIVTTTDIISFLLKEYLGE